MAIVPAQIIAPLATVSLGFLSLVVRWIAGFQLEGTGSDFALISTSLQLSVIFSRISEFNSSVIETLQMDLLIFVVLLVLWGASVKSVKAALQTRTRWLHNIINPYSLLSFIIGTVCLFLEIFWRLQYG
jgi:hypothetical protein